MVYLDNAATTQVSRDVADRVCEVTTNTFANPSSLYGLGFEAQRIMDASRATIAEALGCSSAEVFFTSGGTEANNIAVLGAARARKGWGSEIVVSGYEHPSIQAAAESLKAEGFEVHTVKPSASGELDIKAVAAKTSKNTALVTCMQVNNETGATADIAAMAAGIKSINRRTAVHCDYVQGFLKQPLVLNGDIDTVSISAHKVHGPKGIGALYIRKGFNISKVLHGGGQEQGVRPGTENVAGAAGFAQAATAADIKLSFEKVKELNRLIRGMALQNSWLAVNSPPEASPYILNISMPGYRSETVLHYLEQREIYVSSGSACTKGARSHTLVAMGLADSLVDSAIRISFCADNTVQDVEALCQGLQDAQKTLARVRG